MSYSIDSITDNCYAGTSCLINKFDIRDNKQLDIVESYITFAQVDADRLMIATIHASNGVDEYLKDVLRVIVTPVT